MTDLGNKRKGFTELLKRLMPMIFAAAGFITGVLAGAFSGSHGALPTPDMSSAFKSPSPFYSVMTCVSSEIKYEVLVYLLGFCSFGNAACLLTAAYRAALAGWSAVYLLERGYPRGLYFIHSATSLMMLTLLCCLAMLSIGYSERFVRGCERVGREEVLSYTVKCLFFVGLTIGVVIIRQLLLLIK